MLTAPDEVTLLHFLNEFAPYGPAPLSPEISVFQGRSLVEVWEAAEKIAGENLPAPFWAYPWAAGCGLARVLLDRPDELRGKRVLDVGAGGGIVSVACAFAGASAVTANDVDPWALAVIRLAAKKQRFDLRFLEADLTEDIAAVEPFDVVVCSDMAYERRMAPRYHALLLRAKNVGAKVFVADAGRTYFDPAGMKQIAEFTLDVPRDLEGVDVRTARVYEF